MNEFEPSMLLVKRLQRLATDTLAEVLEEGGRERNHLRLRSPIAQRQAEEALLEGAEQRASDRLAEYPRLAEKGVCPRCWVRSSAKVCVTLDDQSGSEKSVSCVRCGLDLKAET